MRGRLARFLPETQALRLRGPFSIQPNNDTRTVEYPWAFFAGDPKPGMLAVDVGGSLGGLQFALADAGLHVINVDPGMEAEGVGWPCNQASIDRLNRAFGTNVELRNTTMPEAGFAPESVDRVYSISVIEHLAEEAFTPTMDHIAACLKPGGLFVVTTDLFLNLKPFTNRESNEYGRNFRPWDIVDRPEFRLVAGNPDELYGSPSFDHEKIQERLEQYMIGSRYPAMAQCLVLQKV